MILPKAPEWKEGITRKYCQVKRDGIQIHCYNGRCHTKHPTDITDACKQIPTMQSVWRRQPIDSVVAGELYVPDHPASEVKSALAHQPDRCRFEAFAVSTIDAAAPMIDVSHWLARYGFLMPPLIDTDGRTYQCLYDETNDRNVEGFVLKDAHMLGWTKWKPVHTIDLIVCDTTDGSGKYLGYIGSLVCKTTEGHIVANCSGMTEDERALMTLDDPIGRVVEVAYQYVGAKGRLRHPRFVRFRDDKHVSNCGLWQDLNLEEYWA